MKKALIVSTVSRQFTLFEQGNIKILKELGYEVHCAANYSDATPKLDELEIIKHQIDIERSPLSINQIKAYKQLVRLMEREKFDIVHCHAPMGGVLGRLAAKKCNIKEIIYTAHGFHFYKGAPLINNIVYKNIEKLMARYTDKLITMNEEDYLAAKKFELKKEGQIFKIPGVGVEFKKCENIDFVELKKSLGIPEDAYVILSVGELIKRKNHIEGIKAVSELIKKEKMNEIYYLICGRGELQEYLMEEVKKLGLEKNIKLLGFRSDIWELMSISDLFLFTSFQEGLPKSVMEALGCGKPIIASDIRGNKDLIRDNENGYLYKNGELKQLKEKINLIKNNKKNALKIRKINLEISKAYSQEKVNLIMKKIYMKR